MSIVVALFASLVSIVAGANDDSVHLKRAELIGGRISGLEFSSDRSPVLRKLDGGKTRLLVRVSGVFDRKDSGWSLVYENRTLASSGSRESFDVELEILGQSTTLELGVVGPTGEFESEAIELSFEGWEEHRMETLTVVYTRVAPGIRLASVSFSDSRYQSSSELGLSGQIDFSQLVFNPRIEFLASVFGTLLPISSSRSLSIRFLGGDAHGGYYPPVIRAPWKLGVFFGGHFRTMFAQDAGVGYSRVSGPQAVLILRKAAVGEDTPISFRVQYSLVSGITTLDNREIPGRIDYGIEKFEAGWLLASVGAAFFRFESRGREILTSTFQGGISFEF